MSMRLVPQHALKESADGCAGFSLLELVMVLALVAGAAALAFPAFLRAPPQPGLRAAAAEIAAALRATRLDAVMANGERAMIVDAGAHTISREGYGRAIVIGPGLRVKAVVAASVRTGAQSGRYVFYPDGSASGGAILLSDGAKFASIGVNWLTGAAEISWREDNAWHE